MFCLVILSQVGKRSSPSRKIITSFTPVRSGLRRGGWIRTRSHKPQKGPSGLALSVHSICLSLFLIWQSEGMCSYVPKQKSPRPWGLINATFAFLFCVGWENRNWSLPGGTHRTLCAGRGGKKKPTDTPEVYWFEALLEFRSPFRLCTCVETSSKKT